MDNIQLFKQIVRDELRNFKAQVYDSDTNDSAKFQTFVLDLSVAQSEGSPFPIGFPFKSLVVVSTTGNTDNSAVVNLKFDDNNIGKSLLPLSGNFSFTSDKIISKANLSWSAQAGKTMTIGVSIDTAFNTGATLNTGTVSVAVPSVFTVSNPVVAATTATIISALSATKKLVTIQNNTGATQYLGGSASVVNTVGTNKGFELLAGSTFEKETSAALYIYSVLGFSAGQLTVIEES